MEADAMVAEISADAARQEAAREVDRLKRENANLVKALTEIRIKVHAHNRGGDLQRWLREDIRDLCDATLAKAGR